MPRLIPPVAPGVIRVIQTNVGTWEYGITDGMWRLVEEFAVCDTCGERFLHRKGFRVREMEEVEGTSSFGDLVFCSPEHRRARVTPEDEARVEAERRERRRAQTRNRVRRHRERQRGVSVSADLESAIRAEDPPAPAAEPTTYTF